MRLPRRPATVTTLGLGLTLPSIARAIRRSRYPLEGKVVFLTGGSRGLGLELARTFAKEGAKLVRATPQSSFEPRHPSDPATQRF